MNTLEDMRLFLLAVERGSFTAAADASGVTKQQVSKRIIALESRLGVRLLLRSTRRLSLTPLGRDYYVRARGLVDAFDALEAATAGQNLEPRGRLRITAPLSFGTRYLGRLLPLFLERHPAVDVIADLSDRIVDLIAEGYDLALRIGRLSDSSHIARRIGRSAMLTVASPAYLETRGTPQSPEDLAAHACLPYGHGAAADWLYRVDGRLLRVPVSGRLRTNNGELVRDAAVAGQGLTQLPSFLVADELARGSLVTVLDDCQPPALGIHLLYPQHRERAPAVRALGDFLREQCDADPLLAAEGARPPLTDRPASAS